MSAHTLPQSQNPFESKHTLRLIMKFAVPCVIAFLVSAFYNIVDQIFIGQVVGYLGNAATNVAYPLVTFSIAGAVLIGDGCAANMSLKIGAGKREEVAGVFGNAFMLIIIVGIAFACVSFFFLEPFMLAFGATPTVLPYALDYTQIIVIGLPFSMISIMLNSSIRADGSPNYAMFAMLIGAVLNIGLDAWFMYGFGWGVRGAALATIIGQAVSFFFSLAYIRRFRNMKFERKDMKLHPRLFRASIALGLSSFITQIAIAIVQVVMNNTIATYGALSPYGSDIPLSALGIVMKVNMILISIILGIGVGAQPIWGYHYGAQHYRRVKSIYKISVLLASAISITGFLVFQFAPLGIINLFGQEDALYNEFATRCFQVFLLGVFLAGFQITTSIFFQAIGKPLKSAVLSLSRQTLFLIPLILILPMFFGVDGVLYAGPIADGAAATLTATLIIYEMRLLTRQEKALAQVQS